MRGKVGKKTPKKRWYSLIFMTSHGWFLRHFVPLRIKPLKYSSTFEKYAWNEFNYEGKLICSIIKVIGSLLSVCVSVCCERSH